MPEQGTASSQLQPSKPSNVTASTRLPILEDACEEGAESDNSGIGGTSLLASRVLRSHMAPPAHLAADGPSRLAQASRFSFNLFGGSRKRREPKVAQNSCSGRRSHRQPPLSRLAQDSPVPRRSLGGCSEKGACGQGAASPANRSEDKMYGLVS